MPYSSEIDLLLYQDTIQIADRDGRKKIFDPIRKKWFVLTPEEHVRQLVITHLTYTLSYPLGRIAIEKQLIINDMRKRFDILIYNEDVSPSILIECKAPTENINENTAMQIATYNRGLKADYLWLTNGRSNLFYKMDYKGVLANRVSELPAFNASL